MHNITSSLFERLGLNAYTLGKYAVAEKWFRRLEKREPDSLRVIRNVALVRFAQGEYADAEAYFLREESRFGASYQRHRALADTAYALGKRTDAMRRYKAALEDPESAERYPKERAFLQARITLCADETAFARRIGSAGLFAQAEHSRDRSDEAGRTKDTVLMMKAAEEAVALFLKAHDADPTNWPALNNAGAILMNSLKQPERALECFTKAIELCDIDSLRHNRGLAEASIEKAKEKNQGKGKK